MPVICNEHLSSQFSANLHVLELSITELRPNPENARTHNKKQIAKIRRSIEQFGFVNPVLIDETKLILAGHGRVEAAREMGLQRVATIRLDHLSEAEKRAYVIADNRLAELAGWDEETLAIELQGLMELDIDFTADITGFEFPEIDILVGNSAGDSNHDPENQCLEPIEGARAITQLGDLWCLGEHRMLCGNALDPFHIDQLMGQNSARMVFSDPPYNVRIDKNVCGNGSIRHREFAMASGEMSDVEFETFLSDAIDQVAGHCLPGSLLYFCMDWRHLGTLLHAGENNGLPLMNICVWAKDNGGMGSFYRSQHELISVFKVGDDPYINNVQLGRFGRNRTNVWSYPGVNTLRAGRLDDLAMHPTVKPTPLVADAILDCTHPGDIVVDTFAGSGTTIMAAEQTSRKAFCMELDPLYVDTAIRRWQSAVGKHAVLEESGKTFMELEQNRVAEPTYRVRSRPDAG